MEAVMNRKRVSTTRIGLTVPKVLEQKWTRVVNAEIGHGGVKLLGTALIALGVSLPRELRQELIDWATEAERRADVAGDTRSLLTGFADRLREMLAARAADTGRTARAADSDDQQAMEFFIDRILDPAILSPRRESRDASRRRAKSA
jgi:hypothetical protein